MCGRYFFDIDDSDISKQIVKRINELDLKDFKTKDIYPGDKCLCMIAKGNGLIDLSVKHWGINKLINGRRETVKEKKTFRNLRRCAVIANGFYEWNNSDKYEITALDKYIYLGCLFDNQNDFVILTKEANEDMSEIHNRMPLIMNQKEMIKYLYGSDNISDKHLTLKLTD